MGAAGADTAAGADRAEGGWAAEGAGAAGAGAAGAAAEEAAVLCALCVAEGGLLVVAVASRASLVGDVVRGVLHQLRRGGARARGGAVVCSRPGSMYLCVRIYR
jgi:hypothetical protein